MLVLSELITCCESVSPATCCWAVAAYRIPLCPLNFSLDVFLFLPWFCRYFSYFILNLHLAVPSLCICTLYCWWKYLCWLNMSVVVYNKIYSLIDLGWTPFTLVCTNQAWTTHHISPCGPCLCWSLHSVLIGHGFQRYICRYHPRGHGVIDLSGYFSLVLLTTMAFPTSNHTEQSVLMASMGLVFSTTTLTLKLTDPSVSPWKGLFTLFQWVWVRRITLQAKDS